MPNSHFFRGDGVAVAEVLSPTWARLDALAYRLARMTLPAATDALAQQILATNARLLHFHFLTDARFFLALSVRPDFRLWYRPMGMTSHSSRASMADSVGLSGPALWELDLFLAMSDDMRQDLLAIGCPPEKIQVHYYGTDTSRFRHPSRRYERDDQGSPLTILCCGTLEAKKAQDHILQALRRVELRGGGNFRIVLVGDGPLRPTLERLVAEYGWHDRVTFAGHVPYTSPDLVEYYRQADLFALPSVTVNGDKEGIPGRSSRRWRRACRSSGPTTPVSRPLSRMIVADCSYRKGMTRHSP